MATLVPTLRPPPLAPPGYYPIRRQVAELAAIVVGLGAIILVTPVNHPDYWIPTLTAIAGVILYAIYGLVRWPGAARRWGFIGSPRRADGVVWGVVWTVIVLLGVFVPALALKLAPIDRPILYNPKGYLVWCLVQDFVFFSLALRNLLDLTSRHVAVWTAAALFGLSHYPYYEPYGGFMLGTGLAALWWGYVFASSRVIWFVTLPHAFLGILVMG